MTTTDVREAGGDLDVSEAPLEQRGHHRGRRWILAAVAFVVLAGALGYLVGNEVQANTQFDQAHHSLDVTRIRIARVDVQLASVRRQLTGLQGQVTQDSATLAADTNKLNSAKVALADAEANVLCPATKLWNTGHGANMLREAVSLMGGYGITEDCPGFLGAKWMDAQLEATYEGPEAVQRRQMTVTMTSEVFLAQFRAWIAEMRLIASSRPGTGACTLASAMQMWQWTLNHLQKATDPGGNKLYHGQRQGVTFALADALCWLVASRAQIIDVLELEARGPADPVASEGLEGTVQFLSDLCHTQAAKAAGEVSRISAELVFGYNCHPSWDEQEHRSCFLASELEEYEETMPGISAFALDVLAADGSHPQKAGPCAGCAGNDDFLRLQSRLTACLTGSRLAKDRAAETVSKVMIPEALDYPA